MRHNTAQHRGKCGRNLFIASGMYVLVSSGFHLVRFSFAKTDLLGQISASKSLQPCDIDRLSAFLGDFASGQKIDSNLTRIEVFARSEARSSVGGLRLFVGSAYPLCR
jgi:hypothetical protein